MSKFLPKSLPLSLLLTLTVALCYGFPALADDTSAEEQAAEQADKADADPFQVPDGTPEELLDYLGRTSKLRPKGRTIREVLPFLRKQAGAMVEACDKLLASDATENQKQQAARIKLMALLRSSRFGDPSAIKSLEGMPAALTKLGLTDLARVAQGTVLQVHLAKAIAGAPGAESLEKVIKTVKAFIAEKPDRNSYQLANGVVQQLARRNKVEQAGKLCDEFVKMLAKGDQPKLLKNLEGIGRRIRLVGNPMEIKGTTIDGKEFDWSAYQGKVVLVQYWATWCRPCLDELPNVMKNYEAYRGRGFDVVGISLDRSEAKLKKFLKKEPLPWTIIYNGESPDAGEGKFPNATYYGVSGIPTLFLVGADGKVVTTNARGKNLEEQLEKLLGPADDEATEEEEKKDE